MFRLPLHEFTKILFSFQNLNGRLLKSNMWLLCFWSHMPISLFFFSRCQMFLNCNMLSVHNLASKYIIHCAIWRLCQWNCPPFCFCKHWSLISFWHMFFFTALITWCLPPVSSILLSCRLCYPQASIGSCFGNCFTYLCASDTYRGLLPRARKFCLSNSWKWQSALMSGRKAQDFSLCFLSLHYFG